MAKKKEVEAAVETGPECPDCNGTGLYSGLEPSVFTPYCPTCEGRGTATEEQVQAAIEAKQAADEAAAEAARQAEEEAAEEEEE